MSNNKGRKSKSSRRWLDRQHKDEFVKKAKDAGFRSRAAFKLQEIQSRDKILKFGQNVVDLGGAPGGWSQVAAKIVGSKGSVVALDLLPIESIPGVDIIQGDFSSQYTYDKLINLLDGRNIDVVLSDIAPNLSGIRAADQANAVYLAEKVLDFAVKSLTVDGVMLVKVFQGEGFQEYLADVRKNFKKVATRKPKSSRQESREVYILAREKR